MTDKKIKTFSFLFVYIVLLTTSIWADVVFNDGLENHSLGTLTLPATPDIGYQLNIYTGSFTSITVQDSIVKEGNKALQLVRGTDSAILQAYPVLDAGSANPEKDYDIITKQSWYRTSETATSVFQKLGDGWTVSGWYTPGTTYKVWKGSTGTWQDTGISVGLNQWETIELVAHVAETSSGQITINVDMWLTAGSNPRTLIASNIPMGTHATTTSQTRTWICPSPNTTTYWDDISIEKKKHYGYGMLCSWGDNIVLFGAETDVAVDTAQAIHNMMLRWKTEGWDTHILWSWEPWWMSEPYFSDHMYMNQQVPPLQLQSFVKISNVADSFDVMSYIKTEADNLGMTLWVYRMLYNDGSLVDDYFPYQFKFMYDHPEYITVDRNGNPQYGIREMAYPEARAEMVEQYVDMVEACELKNVMVTLKTEVGMYFPLPEHADQFGFNTPVVNAMQSLYGVNILTDSRFDYTDPNWDPYDSMVENWRELRGSYLTQFLRDLRDALDDIDPDIKIGILTGRGDYIGAPYGNMKLQWRTWVDEGIIDMLMVVDYPMSSLVQVPGCFYVASGTGTIPYSTYHNYIAASAHPEIKFFKGGGAYNADTDGAITDSISQDTGYAQMQRAEQIEDNLLTDGYITVMQQNFDSFPVCSPGWTNGGHGDAQYFPSLNSSPGWWQRFGDGTDLSLPVIQNTVFHGASGNAIRINGGGSYIIGRQGQNRVDPSFDNGHITVDFWIYRNDSLSSFVAYSTNSGSYVYQVGIVVGTGSNGSVWVRSNNTWVSTGKTLSAGQWHRISMELDADEKEYSVYTGEGCNMEIYTGATWSSDINFNAVLFFPNGGTSTNITYFDDVTVRWIP